MISSFHVALKNAIDVIAPPATPLQDFTYHWKQLMGYYVNHLSDCKVPVESTGVPRHLDHLLKILQREEDEMTSEEPGPCLEYLLQHRLLDLLATLASAETPPGIRLVCLSFFKRLLGRSKYPLLHQSAIYGPVRRLIVLCNGNYASPIEPEEVQFLLTLCFLVCKYPHVTNIINESNEFLEKDLHDQNPWEKPEIERVTYSSQSTESPTRKKSTSNPLFEPLSTQAITLVNPHIFDLNSQRSNKSIVDSPEKLSQNCTSQGEGENSSEKSTPLSKKLESLIDNGLSLVNSEMKETEDYSEDNASCEIDKLFKNSQVSSECGASYDAFGTKRNVMGESLLLDSPDNSKCLLLDALISYINSADNTVRIRACEGIMVLATLEDPYFVKVVVRSELPIALSNRLESLFKLIPAHVDPLEIDDVTVTWGLDAPAWTSDKKFPGCRQVAAFLMWLDYCDQMAREAHPDVAQVIASTIRISFFEKLVTPTLSEHHVVLITALITKCLKDITSDVLFAEMSHWLVGHHSSLELPNAWTSSVLQRLIENCCTEYEDLTLETLKLFEEMIEKRNEHILNCLILNHLSTRGYYDNSAADSAISSWSDEEDEREKDKKTTLDGSFDRNHSRTLAPSSIHRILNCFLSAIPRNLQSDQEVSTYEKYMADWEKQYLCVIRDCALFAWPLEAVTLDDSASSDSRPEADHGSSRFYMGPFLTMLMNKICNIPKQKYHVNYQLTVLILRLALLPHPYLHEFFLNPLIPLVPGTKSLYSCLQKVIKQLVNEATKIPEYKTILKDTRQKLFRPDCNHNSLKDSLPFVNIVIVEEFCKELAAIAYIKYQRST